LETEVDMYAKSAALIFIGEDTQVRSKFLSDVESSYYAYEEIVYLFQQVSRVIFQIFIGVASAYIFYRLFGKRNSKKSQDKFEAKIRKILQEYQNHFDFTIRRLEEHIETHSKAKERETKRYKSYIKKANLMKDKERATQEITKITKDVFEKDPEEQGKFLSKYR
jgi:uncharacterized membrane protein YgaE (UPF0421/DUF939 family)